MDENHLVTMGWWVGGLECIMVLVLAYLIYNEQNNQH